MNEGGCKTVEKGGYRYLLNGQPMDIVETWERSYLDSGEQEIVSLRRAQAIEIRVQAGVRDGQVYCFDVSWSSEGQVLVQAEYRMDNHLLQVRRSVGTGGETREEIPLERDSACFLAPLMRVFTGPVISGLLAAKGQGVVILPAIDTPSDHEALLRPKLSARQARILDDCAEVEIEGHRMPSRLCEYTGDQYAAGTQFWLGEDNSLLRYRWQQSPEQLWDVQLTR